MNSDFVYVCSADGQLAGDMIRILLESMGIPAITSQESAGITYGLTVGPLGEVKIFVPEKYLEEAKDIILAADKDELNSTLSSDLFDLFPKYKNNKFPKSERPKL